MKYYVMQNSNLLYKYNDDGTFSFLNASDGNWAQSQTIEHKIARLITIREFKERMPCTNGELKALNKIEFYEDILKEEIK